MVKARKIVRKVTKASKANSAFELTINLHKRLSGVYVQAFKTRS